MGEKRAGDGTQEGRNQEKWEINLTALHNFLQWKKVHRSGNHLRKAVGTGGTRYRKWEIHTPLPPPYYNGNCNTLSSFTDTLEGDIQHLILDVVLQQHQL